MVVSPVKVSEYILSKTIALIAISTIIAVILGFVSGSNHLLGIAVGTALTSAIFTMLGIIAATNFKLEPISHCDYADRNCLLCSTYRWSVCKVTRYIPLFSVHSLHEPHNWKKHFTIV